MALRQSPPTGPNAASHQRHNESTSSPIRRPRSRSPATSRRLQIKNRRRRYLDLHPEYLDSPSLELADPLAYDRLIRQFQSADEREQEGRNKGYVGALEADLWRQEAKSAARSTEIGDAHTSDNENRSAVDQEAHGLDETELPEDKEQGTVRWRSMMEARFTDGEDADFDYESVDSREEFDDRALEEREEEEKWFDEEEAAWADDRQVDEGGSNIEGTKEDNLTGQTGIQDF